MLKPECLNSENVLTHLNSLGYYDITPKQLKEFLHDLKKLIKYDQKLAMENKSIQYSECGCSCSQCFECSNKFSSDNFLSNSSNSVCSTATADSKGKHLKFSEINKRSYNPTNSEIAQTAQISFIRPWNIQGCKAFSSKGKKNLDPVRLYHQYKEFWSRQSIPGESKHSDLRWLIRNKMLGQEPNPKVYICNN